MAQAVNKLSDTALGKSLQTAGWLLGSYIVAAVLAWVSKHNFTGAWVAVPGIVNFLAYSYNVIKDQTVPTLPSSQPMTLVPAAQPTAPVVVKPTLPAATGTATTTVTSTTNTPTNVTTSQPTVNDPLAPTS